MECRVTAKAEFTSGIKGEVQSLADLPNGIAATVVSIDEQKAGQGVARRLAEIGFLPGESIQVLARVPGGDPMAVRIGSSTFALRRHEASCVRIHQDGILRK